VVLTLRKQTVFWFVAAAIVAIILVFVLVFTGQTDQHRLYIDLTASPIYARNGFDVSLTRFNDLPAAVAGTNWDSYVPPGHNGYFLVNDLPAPPGYRPYRMFHPGERPIEAFTLLIPFHITPEQYANLRGINPVHPALHFASIGENWEIYINGVSVARQIHLDDQGRITFFRSNRGTDIPFDGHLLRSGENLMVIHVLGARSSSSTGLYDARHYIGDSAQVLTDAKNYFTLMLSTTMAILGLYHILLFSLRRTDRNNIWFGAFALFNALYFFARSPLINMAFPNAADAHRVEYGALYLMVFFAGAFFENANHGRLKLLTQIYGAFSFVLTILQFVFTIWFAYDLLRLWQVISIGYVGYILLYQVIWTMVQNVRTAQAAEGESSRFWQYFLKNLRDTDLGNFFVLVLFAGATSIFDILDSLVFHTNLVLSRYGFLGFMLAMAFVLAKKYVLHNTQTEQLNELLEVVVRQRTHQLEQQMRIAENANRSKSDFLAKMSHEIRTPMNAVMGMSELALREDMSETAREHNQTIRQASLNLLSIINDILDFSKIENGQLEILPETYRLSSLIGDVASIIKMRILDSRLRFLIHVSSQLPDALFGDAARLRQIMQNLLSNAVKYTETGHVTLTVTGAMDGEDTLTLTIKVEDTGRGIREEDMPHLFDDFAQFDLERNRGIEGTGLGLPITHGLVRAMGGIIEVESEYGRGSTFTVTVPQAVRSREPLAVVADPAHKRVLIFERREACIASITQTMADLGVDYHLVTTASAFYNELTSSRYAFVFVSSFLYDHIKKLYADLEPSAKIVLIAEFGETVGEKNISTLTTPIYATPIAAILNGTAEPTSADTQNKSDIGFTAPAARVLIVDDIQTNLRVAEGLLQPYKMAVDLCKSGMEAIELAQERRYDLILMDQMMPFMSGIETTQRIRAMGETDPYCRNIPIIALTANAVLGTQEMILEKGFDDFLSKPIDTQKLNAMLEKWIPYELQDRSAPGKPISAAKLPKEDSQLLSIPGVDVKYGIRMLGGSAANFRRTLSVFFEEGHDKVREIKTCLATEDLSTYAIHVHALKSAMGSIGALGLSREAGALEDAAAAGNHGAVAAQTPAFIEGLETLLGHIESALQQQNGGVPNTERPPLEATLLKLKHALADYDVGGINDASAALQEHLPDSEFGNRIGAVLRHKLAGAYEEAAELIDQLISDTGR
jgi:signal transduction histidine kinase/CheY-like chemotaxis protein/HPt (histidine-containing phosphotransfer) domain-containing protein